MIYKPLQPLIITGRPAGFWLRGLRSPRYLLFENTSVILKSIDLPIRGGIIQNTEILKDQHTGKFSTASTVLNFSIPVCHGLPVDLSTGRPVRQNLVAAYN